MQNTRYIIHKIALDTTRPGIQARIPIRRGDSLVHKISVRLTRGGITLRIPTMIWSRAEATRPDGTSVYADCTFDGNCHTFVLPAGFTEISGATICRIVLRGAEGEELYSPAFTLDAEGTPLPEDVAPAEEYSPMGEVVRTVEEYRRDCNDAADRVAEMIAEFGGTAPDGGFVGGKVPTKMSELENDAGYLTDDALADAVEDALATAADSGNFKGDPGEKGDPGDPGQPGAPGADGAAWFTGTINTTTIPLTLVSGAKKGDFYLNTDTGKLYQATDSAFVYKTTIKGADGDDGAAWFTGTFVTGSMMVSLVDGAKPGDFYLNTNTNDLYQAGQSQWAYKTTLAGAKGDPGEKGDPGQPGYTPVKGTDYFTAADKAEIAASALANIRKENWTFTLKDGTTVTKAVHVG